MLRRALVFGVGGQDGAFLARLLLSKGYEVWGSSRDARGGLFPNLEKLGIRESVNIITISPSDFRSVLMGLQKTEPDEIYFLSGQSSVGLSFDQPAETIESFVLGTLNLLEAVRMLEKETKIYHAGSSECFGDTNGEAASESTPFHPLSPYAVAKASAHWLVNNYRQAYGLFACTGILFNHESTFRSKHFVTQKIVTTANRIANGSGEVLHLGRLDICRDWGWAPEYVEAMWRMLQQDVAEDFVIATGEANSLERFVEITFSNYGLDYSQHIKINSDFIRPSDIAISVGNPGKAKLQLGWEATSKMSEVIRMMSNERIEGI
jgi:GDPmannose 4,6-dehydratase